MKIIRCIAGTALALSIGCARLQKAPSAQTEGKEDPPLAFQVSFPSTVRAEPATGRLLLFLTRAEAEPRRHINWLDLDPVFAVDVTNLAPNTTIEISPGMFGSPDALAYPTELSNLEPGKYSAQALLDINNTARDWNNGPSNLYSASISCNLKGSRGETYTLSLTNVVAPERSMQTNEWVRLIELKSELLTAFHGRDQFLRAGVLLPKGYSESTNRYPVVYQIPGFGGRHRGLGRFLDSKDGKRWKNGEYEYAALHVVLDPEVPLGHSVFANSDNNGPVGDALVRELIPAIESTFRVIPDPSARAVSGHSSGGWSSLWLQVAYPDFFGGCWSSAPDPVDFRFFQTLDIYADRNGHWAPDGQPRGLARDQHRVLQTFAHLNHWE